MHDEPAQDIEQAGQVVERIANVDLGNVHVQALIGTQGLHKAGPLLLTAAGGTPSLTLAPATRSPGSRLPYRYQTSQTSNGDTLRENDSHW
jgi:hypothetical protein